MQDSIFLPCIALVFLTAVIWARGVHDRIVEIKSRRISPQRLKTSADCARELHHLQAMDNFNNLLELPVLFYLLCLSLVLTRHVSPSDVLAAWVFVTLRVMHSLIHATYNRVTHRFVVWALGSLWLFGMWAGFAYRLIGV